MSEATADPRGAGAPRSMPLRPRVRARGGAGPRLRRAVLAADRAADPRMRGVRRAAAGDDAGGEDPGAGAEGAGPLRRAGLGLRAGGAGVPDRAARPRHPDARHLLRDAGDGPGARRQGRGGRVGRVRPHRAHPPRRRRPPARRPARGAELLDEPPRRGLRAAARVHRAGLEPRLAGGRLRGARPRPLRDPVPPRGRPHPLRDRDPHPLPARRRRLRAAVVAAVGDRRAGRKDPGPGRRRPGDLRPLRRRRLLGRGAARPQGGGRAADLRLRRPRADADERGRAGGRGLRAVRHPAGPRRRRRALPRQAGRRRTTPRPSARSSARSSSASSRRRRRSSRTSATWSRARSTRT